SGATHVAVEASSDRGLDTDITVPAGVTTADVRLKRGVVVSGTIRVGGQPEWPAYHVNLGSTRLTGAADGTYRASVAPGTYSIDTDNDDDEPGGESDDHWNATTTSSSFKITADTTLDFDYPRLPSTSLRFVGTDGATIEGEIGYSSSSEDETFELAPGITASGSSWFSSFGDRDRESVELWPGGTVSGGLDADGVEIDFTDAHFTPGGEAVVALVEGYNLLEPEPPTVIAAVAGAAGAATISWDGTANGHGNPIVGYRVGLGGRDDRHFITPATTCITVAGLQPGTRYYVSVAAITMRGIGEPGPGTNLTVPAADDPQAVPAPACSTLTPPTGPPAPPPGTNPPGDSPSDGNFHPSVTPATSGYWALSADGKVYQFGAAPQLGNGTTGAVDLEPTSSGKGYWTLNKAGQVQAFGDAVKLGDVDTAELAKNEAPASMSATPSGKGYWVFTNRGRAIPFGDAAFLGDVSAVKLNGPVLGSVATPSGRGYYMVASDGDIFAFGDARFEGSMGGTKLNAPVQSLVPDSDGSGYWLVASDGGIFAFDAPFRGSLGGVKLNKPVVGMVRYGDGYLMVGADGGIFNFSTLPFSGSLGDKPPASPVVAVATLP
ncbi:MAG TPA: fibronectin type III domain-containing protein, partial [Acidimicrobiia bacterium]|nr:fibronectin type III domain-containing protein [Acidimicrobiia bacterium]